MIWLAAITGLCVGMLGTAVMRRLAPRIGLVDAPDGIRKMQSRPIPLGGGLAVFLAAILGTCAALAIDDEAARDFVQRATAWWAFLAAATLLVVVGLLDDWYELIARYKLLGQLIAAAIVVFGGGLSIKTLSVFGVAVELGPVAGGLLTLFWLIFAINSLNLLDGMDGLLGTVGSVTCLAMAGVAFITGQHLAAAVALATAGGLLGFLRYNYPPASIYLGDCGSMLIGLIVGALCIEASLKSHLVATLVPMCVLILPFLDTLAAVIRRKLSGRSMAQADREHLHHVLLRRGLSVRMALVIVAIACGLAGMGAIASVKYGSELIGIGTSLAIAVSLLVTGLFGTTEWKLVANKMSQTARLVSRRPPPDANSAPPSRPAPAAQSPGV